MRGRPDAGAADRAKRWGQRATVAALVLVVVPLLVAGILAALGLLGDAYSPPFLTVVFWFGCFGAFVNTVGTLVRAAIPKEDRNIRGGYGDMPQTLNLIKNTLWMTLPVALFGGGHYGQGALFTYIVVLQVAARAEDRRILGEEQKTAPILRAIRQVVFAAAEALARLLAPIGGIAMRPVWNGMPLIGLFLLPVLLPLVVIFAIPLLLYIVVRDRQVANRLVRDARVDGKLVWFAYSEPHQHQYFTAPGGVLHGLDDVLISRDWRKDMTGIWERDSETDLDAMIANRLGLTNMREHLPIIVLFRPNGKLHPVRLNKAYRQRLRDNGKFLKTIEQVVKHQLMEIQPAE